MAKQPQKTKKASAPASSPASGSGFFTKHPNTVFLGIIAILLIVFFHEAFFSGKVFTGGDTVAFQQYEAYIQYAKDHSINTFWNPYIFGGMPAWGSHVPGGEFAPVLPPMLILKAYGLLQAVVDILPVPGSFWDIVNYFLLGLFTFFFSRNRKLDRYAAFIAALSVVFSMYTINWIMAGHGSKITVFSLIPAALLVIDKLFEKRSVLNVLFLILIFHLQFNAAHLQIIFYSVIVLVFYFLFKLYEGAKIKDAVVVGLFTLFAAVVAFVMLSQNYLGMWEYKQYSIREAGSGGSDSGARGGLDYNYATNWSFSPLEVVTFFIPSFVGFGSLTYTYWGQMPFTESPVYLGIVICALALIGIILRPKDKFVHLWVLLGLFSLLVSFGREFPLLYNFFFNHVPFFNNFRIPSMILCLEVLCVGMLGAVGADEIFKRMSRKLGKGEKGIETLLLRGLIAAGALFLLVLVGKGVYESSYISMVKSSGSRSVQFFEQVENAIQAGQASRIPPEYMNATFNGVFGMAYRDTLVALGFLILLFGILYAAARKKLGMAAAQSAIALLLVIDFWIVDYKPLHMVTKQQSKQGLQATDYVDFLKKDPSLYRILPLPPLHHDDNWYVAFGIQSVSGYHPAKLKLYDDIRNGMFGEFGITDAKQLAQVNWKYLDMLNTKYVLTQFPVDMPNLRPVFQGAEALVYENLSVLPRAFFVGSSVVIPDDKAMFAKINAPDYDPATTAYLSQPLEKSVSATPEAIAASRARFTKWDINGYELETEAPSAAILKVSEVYYPSGWRATIDGAEIPMYRCDYALRAIVVPAGKHTVVFSFEPKSYRTGLLLTTLSNYAVGAILLVYLGLWLRRKYFPPAAPAPRQSA